MGYKAGVKMLPEHRRQFSRLSGMMELIDDEFSRLRMVITDYRRLTLDLVKNGQLDDVPLSRESFLKYLELKPFDRLNRRIAAVNQAEIFPVSLMFYLPVFESFGFKTLGDVQRFIDEHSDDAYHLALSQLAVTDYDFFASSIAPQNLCLVYVMKNDGSREALKRLYDMLNGAQDSNGNAADQIMEMAKTLPFMSKKTD